MSDSQATEPRYPEGYWDGGAEYLRDCFLLQHNEDYLEFLVRRVWRIEKPVELVEFGCGSGKMGMKLLPLLPRGSSYTGLDQSAALLEKGRAMRAGTPFRMEFFQGSIFEAPFPDQHFDIALAHTVLMHVPRAEKALAEMIRVTRLGGLVITCESNRNAHTALLHIEETHHQESAPLSFFQRLNSAIHRRTGVDHNIGIKLPVLMHKAGLVNVQARISDAVRCLFPPLDSQEKQRLFKAICDEGYGQPQPDEAGRARWKANLVGLGFPEAEAEAEIQRELDEDFLTKGPGYHTVYPTGLTWSFGVVPE
ncbi:MAG TPA: class I SAM-dependent methyltransferase [Anaerolineaceae bacterium]|nr:class I SAM-dependent methyltransferase [Anaerolineaceae bacterium]